MSEEPRQPEGEGLREPTEDELRAAYEAEIKRLRVSDLILQTIVSLVNLAGRRAGLAPGAEDERDPEQLRDAIDAINGLLPVLERQGVDLAPIRDAVSQLQLAYANPPGPAPGPAPTPGEGAPQDQGPAAPEEPEGPGPAQSSGRLWVPGQ